MKDPVLLHQVFLSLDRTEEDLPSLEILRSIPVFEKNTRKRRTNAVCYLIQNKPFTPLNRFGFPREQVSSRIQLLFRSLTYLLRNSPPTESFDIHLFHEGDLTPEQTSELLSMATPERLIYLHTIRLPSPPRHVDVSIVQDRIQKARQKGYDAYRDMSYRNMCSFYSFYVYDVFLHWGYEKMMRLDDDSFLLEKLDRLFTYPQDYVYRLSVEEDPRYMLYYQEVVDRYCHSRHLPLIKRLERTVFNNFFVLRLSIYKDPLVRDFLNYIYRSGGIYYFRWGDAIVQSTLLKLQPHFSILPLTFDYQKWGYTYYE